MAFGIEEKVLDRIACYSIPEPTSGCFLWLGALAGGRPCLRIADRCLKVARLVLSHKLGRELRDKECALHSCDNGICVNADHLHAGTQADNMRELAERRKKPQRGENTSRAKLTEVQVLAIRASTKRPTQIARDYGVSYGAIKEIRSRRNWSHI